MFEIGNSLHEARSRRGIDFPEAELATKIRGKYLRALEDERFELLPAQTYIKGFLRTYAEYLGLDGQLYVDEYNSRFGGGDDGESRARRSAARPQRRNRRIETNVVLISLAAIAVVTVDRHRRLEHGRLAASDGAAETALADHGEEDTQERPAAAAADPAAARTPRTSPSAAAGRTAAWRSTGHCRRGISPSRCRGRRLWLQVDSPENVRLQVRGRVVHVPGLAPRVIIVTPAGWQIAPS